MTTTSRLSAGQYKEHKESGDLTIALVGMSNVGKSYWSQLLQSQLGFEHFCCDDMIEGRLERELTRLGYSGGIKDVAAWMGQPYDTRFAANQDRYLELETEVTRLIIESLGSRSGNAVVDTTGSIVHTASELRTSLAAVTTVVYLEATSEMRDEMFQLYMENPKPVVWGQGIFTQAEGESDRDALASSYPRLLAHRSALYAEMADVTIPRKVALKLSDATAFIDYIQNSLST